MRNDVPGRFGSPKYTGVLYDPVIMTDSDFQGRFARACELSRRDWLQQAAFLSAALVVGQKPLPACTPASGRRPVVPLFKISLAEWSLNRALFGGKLDHLDFPKKAKESFGIDAVEYVNSFFKEKAKPEYVAELKKRCSDLGVTSVLIMCDGEGHLGDPDNAKRAKAVQNHKKWLEAAQALGCKAIRVNAHSAGTYDEQTERAADGLHALCVVAEPFGLNVIVENHGGLSSNGAWLAGVMKKCGHKSVGTLPDFGNFQLGEGKDYDRYVGVAELMPFAKGVSAKSHAFDQRGEESAMDYRRLLKTVVDAGYTGYIGVEYEGSAHSEDDGIKLTKALLERIREEMTKARAASRPTGG